MKKPKATLVKPVLVKLTEDMHAKVVSQAKLEGRTVSNLIRSRLGKSLDDELLKSIQDESRL